MTDEIQSLLPLLPVRLLLPVGSPHGVLPFQISEQDGVPRHLLH